MSEPAVASNQEPLIVGRYALFDQLAAGGMATVHLGRLLGPGGFGRTVAVKRLHTHYVNDQEFCTMFMDEARIVARIRHPNVVPMVDVVESTKGLFLVMEYVHGESLSKLMRTARAQKKVIPPKIVSAIVHGVLLGLHGAHETKGASGDLINVVHRDVSPQNVMVGADGIARVLDFGIAKAAGRAQVTREGQIKGKLAYMAPEQIRGQVDRRADVFAASVVLWEALASRRLHEGLKEVEIVTRVVSGKFPPPSEFAADIGDALDAIVAKGLAPDPKKRYATAKEMALELEKRVELASPSEVAAWVGELAHDVLATRAEKVAAMEAASTSLRPSMSVPPSSIAQSGGFEAASASGTHSHPTSAAMPSHARTAPPSDPLAEKPTVTPPSLASTTDTGTHTQTPSGHQLPVLPEAPPKPPAILFALLGACVCLGIVGLSLGGYAIYKRSAAPPPAASTSEAPAPPPPIPTASTTAAPEPTTPAPAATAVENEAGAAVEAVTDAGAAAMTSTLVAAPLAPRPAPSAAPKKNPCDPPYTVDELGHRKYKLECIGIE